jgi:hypothetical protein
MFLCCLCINIECLNIVNCVFRAENQLLIILELIKPLTCITYIQLMMICVNSGFHGTSKYH